MARQFIRRALRRSSSASTPAGSIRRLPAGFDAELLADLPADVDPCGENGEFHTFVHAGPIFSAPIACHVGETVERDGFVFCDVLAAGA